MEEPAYSTPTNSKDRIKELDIWRGFAILGIFMVNILVMNVSFLYRGEWEAEQTGVLNKISFFLLETFFYSKFFAIFSLLFGMGVALQLKRAHDKGNYSNTFFIRRFTALFLMGICHILFIWAGDILHLYGILGIILLLFFRFSAKVILWSAILVFLFPFYHEVLDYIMALFDFDGTASLMELSRQEIIELKHDGSYWSGVELRLKEYGFAMGLIWSGIAPVAFTMMLLGGYFVKKGLLNDVMSWLQCFKWYLFGALIILLVYRFVLIYFVFPNFEIPMGSPLSVALVMIFQLSDISLSFSFLWLLAYCWNKGYLIRLIQPMSYVGRMALSNYIMQSVLAYWIMRTFNGYEAFSAFQCVTLVLSIYTLQILLSKLWFRFYRFGPLEWVWRSISYMKVLPIKKVT